MEASEGELDRHLNAHHANPTQLISHEPCNKNDRVLTFSFIFFAILPNLDTHEPGSSASKTETFGKFVGRFVASIPAAAMEVARRPIVLFARMQKTG